VQGGQNIKKILSWQKNQTRGSGGAYDAPPVGCGAKPCPPANFKVSGSKIADKHQLKVIYLDIFIEK